MAYLSKFGNENKGFSFSIFKEDQSHLRINHQISVVDKFNGSLGTFPRKIR